LVGYRRTSSTGQVPSRLTGPTVPVALHLSRHRFPTLTTAEARRIGGAVAEVDDEVLRFAWSITAEGTESSDDEAAPEQQNPAVHLLEVLDALQHHDSHRHGRPPGE
jgi:hypothetical protein